MSSSLGIPGVQLMSRNRTHDTLPSQTRSSRGVTTLVQALLTPHTSPIQQDINAGNRGGGEGRKKERRKGGRGQLRSWLVYQSPHPTEEPLGWVGGGWLSLLLYSFIRHLDAPGDSNSNAPVADKNGAQEVTADSPGLQVPFFFSPPGSRMYQELGMCPPPAEVMADEQ